MKLRLQISCERDPCPALLPERDILNYRCAVLKAKTQPELVVLFAIPDEGESFLRGIRRQPWRGLVFRQVAILRLNCRRRDDGRHGDEFQQVGHAKSIRTKTAFQCAPLAVKRYPSDAGTLDLSS